MVFDNPTPHLRFINRDGRMVLQQWWIDRYVETNRYASALNWTGEWRDVPVAALGGDGHEG